MMLSRDTRMSDLTDLLKVEDSYTTSGDLVFRKREEISIFSFLSPFDWLKGCQIAVRQPVEEVSMSMRSSRLSKRPSLFSGRGWKDAWRCKPSRPWQSVFQGGAGAVRAPQSMDLGKVSVLALLGLLWEHRCVHVHHRQNGARMDIRPVGSASLGTPHWV